MTFWQSKQLFLFVVFFFLSQYGAVRFLNFFLCMHMCVCVCFGPKKEQCVRLGGWGGGGGVGGLPPKMVYKKEKRKKSSAVRRVTTPSPKLIYLSINDGYIPPKWIYKLIAVLLE